VKMWVPTFIMGGVALSLLAMGYQKGGGVHLAGLRAGFGMLVEILPLLIFAFIIAGMVQVMLPQETIARWVGEASGLRGIMVGSLAGGLCPGGPFVSLPIAAGLLRAGAGMGTMVAFLTGWSLWAVSRLPMEVGILGWKLTFARLAATLVFPPLSGILAQALFPGMR